MGRTSIEWCDETLNPLRTRIGGRVGHHCEKVSPGCKFCYSSALQPRFGLPQFQHRTDLDREDFLDVRTLSEPLKRRAPTKFFWADMTDMFGPWVPLEWIAACFGVMAATPRHVHQVLTKRPDQALRFFAWASTHTALKPTEVLGFNARALGVQLPSPPPSRFGSAPLFTDVQWPLESVWLGVSVENRDALFRVEILRQLPAAVRFLSVEPLLEDIGEVDLTGISQVIVGGESGHSARPFNVNWARSIREQCRAAGVAFFLKQLGAHPFVPASEDIHDWPMGVQWVDDPELGDPCEILLTHRKGGDPDEWPEDLRMREWPEVRP